MQWLLLLVKARKCKVNPLSAVNLKAAFQSKLYVENFDDAALRKVLRKTIFVTLVLLLRYLIMV